METDAALRARAQALTWTKDRPTVPGWYWWRMNNDDEEIVFVEWDDNVLFAQIADGWRQISDLEGQWAGPLEPPKETP